MLSGACSGEEMNQGGVKHAQAESNTRLDKRERRRGAAGRAAVLRRAPSDSDCSGETASLSADSGDRVIRPVPTVTRSGKSRSRRRGSEWEVLEGLKDGQRFEKRPDVFNGYLHKKRKWPLKGWHKRFFVVDGGILVYARSPTDVARGRLHGSVDVGLSVISAKARRRRIDIDADEFIYHLRAKTPEVFRTWLNVLKTHRLYRQHLLTFGARESGAKVHAPLDDLPPTDTSSRTSHSSVIMSTTGPTEEGVNSMNSENIFAVESYDLDELLCKPSADIPNITDSTSLYERGQINSINNWGKVDTENDLIPLNFEKLENENEGFNHIFKSGSLCSMNCKKYGNFTEAQSPDFSMISTDIEKQIHNTELEIKSLKSNEKNELSIPLCEFNLIGSIHGETVTKVTGKSTNVELNLIKGNDVSANEKVVDNNQKPYIFTQNKVLSPTTCFFFTRKKNRNESAQCIIRKSKKSTNVVKYKNIMEEPTLKRPLSKCMLLDKCRSRPSKRIDKSKDCGIGCDTIHKEHTEAQVEIERKEKALQNVITASQYDLITERLMVAIFEGYSSTEKGDEVKYYINQVIKDLYDARINTDMHPVKALFRSLLEYWLKNTSISNFKEAMTRVKSIDRQSNKYFTKDENLSSLFFNNVTKGTQFPLISELFVRTKLNKPNSEITRAIKKRTPPKCSSPRRDTASFEKERRIQELEKLLKNTVYICETPKSREKDIKITKTLIDNLEKHSQRFFNNKTIDEDSNSSIELPKLQETINHLISETAIPPDVAKEFLGVYLDILLQDSNKTVTNTSSQSSEPPIQDLKCEVQTESVIKKVCRSAATLERPETRFINTNNTVIDTKNIPIDPGQLYLRDILDKITTMFSKVKKFEERKQITKNEEDKTVNQDKKSKEAVGDKDVKIQLKDELGHPAKELKNRGLIRETLNENSLAIDLSKYNLERISMFSDPNIKGMMSITIKLQKKLPNYGESNQKHLTLKFSNDNKPNAVDIKEVDLISYLTSNNTSSYLFNKDPMLANNKNPYFDYNAKDFIDLKPFLSCSDATSKAYKFLHESEHSLDLSFRNDHPDSKNVTKKKSFENDDTQSCYIMSALKKGVIPTKFQSKKKVKLKDYNGIAIGPSIDMENTQDLYPEQYGIFEKPVPKVIDEKFILLLLENLMLLSKGVPSLNSDISNLYIKLKKKHEKVVKNCGTIQGLSLLGKIYNEETCNKSTDAITVQFIDKYTQSKENRIIVIKSVATNTNFVKTDINTVEKETSIIAILKECLHASAQTDIHVVNEQVIQTSKIANKEIASETYYGHKVKNINDVICIAYMNNRNLENNNVIVSNIDKPNASKEISNIFKSDHTQTISTDSLHNERIIRTEEETSNLNYFDNVCLKDCAISTVIKCILNNDHDKRFRFLKIDKDVLKKSKKCLKKTKHDLIKKISLSPALRVSTQSQTEIKLLKIPNTKDFKVYRLYLSNRYNLTKSSSLTMSHAENVKSDDLKTIYRCNSDPSCSSG